MVYLVPLWSAPALPASSPMGLSEYRLRVNGPVSRMRTSLPWADGAPWQYHDSALLSLRNEHLLEPRTRKSRSFPDLSSEGFAVSLAPKKPRPNRKCGPGGLVPHLDLACAHHTAYARRSPVPSLAPLTSSLAGLQVSNLSTSCLDIARNSKPANTVPIFVLSM